MLKIKREHILQPLQMVVGVVERRHTLPILSHVLIKITGNKLTITATDLEVQLSASVDLDEALPDEEFTLPGRKLLDICKTLPDSAIIEFHLDPHQIIIKCNKSRFNLSRLSSDEFPQLEQEEIVVETTITKNSLYFLLEHTHFAMAQQDVRYFLNGMLMEFASDKMTTVSADGHRMALAWQFYQIKLDEVNRVIVPRKGVLELMRLLGSSESEQITLKVGTHHIHFSCNEFTLSSKLIDGKFPDYQRALPRNGDKTIMINRDEFKEILQRVSVLLDKNRSIRIELAESKLKAIVSNSEQEEAEEEITIDYSAAPLALGFNVGYLLDAVNAMESPTFKITLTDANTGVLMEESGNECAVFVVMPMRI
jgi:DNA polymerase-3 subunit beta